MNLYAREGADVAIVFLPSEMTDAQETKRIVEACRRECLLLPGDLTDPVFCNQAVQKTVREYGNLDILVSNAAYQNRIPSIEKVSDEEFDRTFKTNIYACFYLCRAAVKHMRPGSAIVVTSSETGLEGSEQLLAYSATKGAINAFIKTLSMELAEKGIRVNAVAPRARLDAAEHGRHRQFIREGEQVRAEDNVRPAGAAGGDRTGVCLPRLRSRFKFHQRHRSCRDG